MANVFVTATMTVSFSETITSGLITPETLQVILQIPNIPLCSVTYTNGTAAGQVDTIYGKSLTVNATALAIDLTSVTDLNGASVTFARAREFILFNPDTTAGHDVQVYQGASNGWAPLGTSSNPQIARANGGWVWLHDPNSTGGGNGNVVTSTSKNIVLNTGANNITFYLFVVGGSAA